MTTLPFEADLHNHTTCSDGELTPTELVKEGKKAGLMAIAITDHDTIEGLEEGLAAGEHHNLDVVCGVEVTTRFVEPLFTGSLHLLLYFSQGLLKKPEFVSQTEETLAQGRGLKLTTDRIEAINRHFSPGTDEVILPRPLTIEDVHRHGHRISRRHFALALSDMGLDKEQISRAIGNDSPAYVPSGAPLEALEGYVTRWPLVRILAHPAAGSYPGDSLYKEVLPPYETVQRFLPQFLRLGLDGYEIYYPGHTSVLKRRLEKDAADLGFVLATGGSDCHDRDTRPLAQQGVKYSVVQQMRELFAAKEAAMRSAS